MEKLIEQLNAPTADERLEAAEEIKKGIDDGSIPAVLVGEDVNNHIHTTYSFSPYSPAKAAYMAYAAGLKTAGIMDHDSVSGVHEFLKAADIFGILSTAGVECRCSVKNTKFADKNINNPDQKGVIYTALHGIPHQNVERVAEFFKPIGQARERRNIKMTEKINALLFDFGISLDYFEDIVPLSQKHDSGSVTERHLLCALSLAVVDKFGKGAGTVEFLNNIGFPPSGKILEFLSDESNPYYLYDLLGALKGSVIEKVYVETDTDECPPVESLIALGKEVGAITVYPYLGDVGSSVTGDKKAQKFEDDFLDELFVTLKELDFNAIAYMPSRNTMEQLMRVRALCDKFGFFQITGEDINTPRQSFICYAQRAPEFANLYSSTMALIGHERAATKDISKAMFSQWATNNYPSLEERIKYYSGLL